MTPRGSDGLGGEPRGSRGSRGSLWGSGWGWLKGILTRSQGVRGGL